MAITDAESALDQYNQNLDWNTDPTKANLALQAIRYLLVNRAKMVADVSGVQVQYESLEKEKAAIEGFLGARSPRARGRSRCSTASYSGNGGIS